MLDVGRPGSAIRAQRRSFGGKPRRVIRTAIRFASAMERRGVSATAKHFPGLGAADESTDLAVQRIRLKRGELRRIDERPYRAFVAREGDMVMISTAIYTRFSRKPAAFSKRIATRELRRRLGFGGVSISDALETVSARHFGGPGQGRRRRGEGRHRPAPVHGSQRRRSRRAGAPPRARSGKLARGPFEDSAQRVLDLRARLPSRLSRAV